MDTKSILSDKATKFVGETEIERCFVFLEFHFLFILCHEPYEPGDTTYRVWFFSETHEHPRMIYRSNEKPDWGSLREFVETLAIKLRGERVVEMYFPDYGNVNDGKPKLALFREKKIL